MTQVFAPEKPVLAINMGLNSTEKDEQKGMQFLCAGAVSAIRNPRGHEYAVKDDPDLCLDHLSLASMLLRRLNDAGYK